VPSRLSLGWGIRCRSRPAQREAAYHGANRFVMVADARYHAVGLYESLRFQPRGASDRRLPLASLGKVLDHGPRSTGAITGAQLAA
jgi:hypothetical protein